MEKIEKILEFIEDIGCGYGNGCGYGDDCGDGDDCGYGYGNGCGSGDGYSCGCGYGNGNGYGYGDGDGYGYGDGGGSKIKIIKINSDSIFYIDEQPTIFDHIRGNIAKGRIIDFTDFSTKFCYIVKANGYVAHEDTIEKAMQTIQQKIWVNMNIEQRINEFRKTFNNIDRYSGNEFFKWHNILTGSCMEGRENFVKSNGYDLNKTYTVKEFISICENSYGGEIIKILKNYYR